MLSISDILIRSISGYVFIVPVLLLYFLYLKKSGRKQSFLHITAVFVFCYYLFGILTVAGIGYTSTISFSPKISLIPFLGMITGPIDTILNLILFVPLGVFLPFLYKRYHITTQRNGQTIVAELFFNPNGTETFSDKLLKTILADSLRFSASDGQEPEKTEILR